MNFVRAPPAACSTSGRAASTRHAHAPTLRTSARSQTRVLTRSARADTVPVWETLIVVNGAAGSSQTPEEQQELLDTLWTLQYRTPGACCASAGPILQSATRDGAGAAQAAVYYRFSAQAQAERFVAGPAFADAKARLLGSATLSLSLWKVLVPSDMEALFKRGPAFETGVDVILSLEPAAGAAAPAVDALVETVGRLQSAAMAANSVQVSCGADLLSMSTKLMWMGRFPQEGSARRFLRSPAVVELSPREGGSAAPLVLTSMALIEIGVVEQSKERM